MKSLKSFIDFLKQNNTDFYVMLFAVNFASIVLDKHVKNDFEKLLKSSLIALINLYIMSDDK